MNIVIHRRSVDDALYASRYIYDRLIPLFGNQVKLCQHRLTIDVFDVHIDIRCGEVEYLFGLRPDIYNADTYRAANSLQQYAAKVNGKAMDTHRICEAIIEHVLISQGTNRSVTNAFVELCEEDPVMFLEKFLNIELLGYQKVYIREVFKSLKEKQNADMWMRIFQQEPINPKCGYCKDVGTKLP